MRTWSRFTQALGTAALAGCLAAGALSTGPVSASPVSASPGDGAGTTPAYAGTVVPTDRGLVRGTLAKDHRAFEGIPYAAPPTGERRWKDPERARPWSGVRQTTKPGPRCAQPADPTLGTPASDAEDCLYLNVTTPRRPALRPRPVAVWIHGGGYKTGAGGDNAMTRLAVRGDLVVVSINYRLGALGFLAHEGISGNFGLRDQQAALAWVRRNAAFFGGDPRAVTVFGESAGGDSVCAQLTSPGARGLFDRAVMQSGSCSHTNPTDLVVPGADSARVATWKTREAADALGAEVAKGLGCEGADAVACLRKVPATKLLGAPVADGAPPYWSPVVGSDVLPRHPADALESGRFNRVPLLAGTTRDEGTLFAAGLETAFGAPIDAGIYHGLLDAAFGADAARVEAAYPLGPAVTPGGQWAAIVTDGAYACGNLDSHRTLARRVPTYAYEFADRSAPLAFDVRPSFPMGAYHGADVAYLFRDGDLSFTPAQEALSDAMTDAWIRFVRSGDPNGGHAAAWPRVRAGARVPHVQSLAPEPAGIGPVDLAAEHHCALWADLAEDA